MTFRQRVSAIKRAQAKRIPPTPGQIALNQMADYTRRHFLPRFVSQFVESKSVLQMMIERDMRGGIWALYDEHSPRALEERRRQYDTLRQLEGV